MELTCSDDLELHMTCARAFQVLKLTIGKPVYENALATKQSLKVCTGQMRVHEWVIRKNASQLEV